MCWLLCFKPLIEWPRSESDSNSPTFSFEKKRAALLLFFLPPVCVWRKESKKKKRNRNAHSKLDPHRKRSLGRRCNNLVAESRDTEGGPKNYLWGYVTDTSCVSPSSFLFSFWFVSFSTSGGIVCCALDKFSYTLSMTSGPANVRSMGVLTLFIIFHFHFIFFLFFFSFRRLNYYYGEWDGWLTPFADSSTL